MGYGNQKPPPGAVLDRSHPLAAGLRLCVLFNEAGGSFIRDIASGLIGTLDTGTWGAKPGGDALSSAATRAASFPHSTAYKPTSGTSIVLRAMSATGYWYGTEGALSGFGCYGGAAGPHPYMRIGGAWSDPGTFPAINGAIPNTITQTFNGATHSAYLNGVLKFAASVSGTITQSSTTLDIGAKGAGVNGGPVTAFGLWIYDYALTPDLIAWISAEPYAMVRATTPTRRHVRILQAPTTFAATTFSTTRVDLTWDQYNPVADANRSITIEYGTASNFAGASSVSVDLDSTGYSVTGLTPGTLYYFRAKADELVGTDSDWSATASATTLALAGGQSIGIGTRMGLGI